MFASYEPVPGWEVTIKREQLEQPVEVEGLELDEQVSQITWRGDGRQGTIGPGEFQDFGLSLGIPDGEAGDELTFKALQTYDDGEVVRWIEPPDAEAPAPTVALTAAAEGGGHGAPSASAPAGEAGPAPAAATAVQDSSNTLAIAALIVGALGLAAGIAGIAAARSARAAASRTPA